MLSAPIVARVKRKWQTFRLALVALLVVLGAGCSGIRASHATFFLPGLGKAEPANQAPTQNPIEKTDQIQASVPIVAQAR